MEEKLFGKIGEFKIGDKIDKGLFLNNVYYLNLSEERGTLEIDKDYYIFIAIDGKSYRVYNTKEIKFIKSIHLKPETRVILKQVYKQYIDNSKIIKSIFESFKNLEINTTQMENNIKNVGISTELYEMTKKEFLNIVVSFLSEKTKSILKQRDYDIDIEPSCDGYGFYPNDKIIYIIKKKEIEPQYYNRTNLYYFNEYGECRSNYSMGSEKTFIINKLIDRFDNNLLNFKGFEKEVKDIETSYDAFFVHLLEYKTDFFNEENAKKIAKEINKISE